MTKYKNYRNKYTKNNVIHTIDNIVKMPFGNVVQREKEFSSQYKQIGFPTDKDMKNSSNVVYVEEYTRDDGTVVHAHWRSKPENSSNNKHNNKNQEISDNSTQEFIGNESNAQNNVLEGRVSKIENIPKDEINNTPDKMTIKENILKWLFTNPVTEKLLPMASHSVMDGMDNLSAARKNPNATVYNSPNELKNKDLKNKLKSLGVADNAKGVIYNTDSEESKKIANAPELDIYIKKMLNNNEKPLYNENIHFGINNLRPWDIINNSDRQASLQNVTIYKPTITEAQKFKCIIIDYSDFKLSKYNDIQFANNWGYHMQEKGQYKNYYQIFEIEKNIPQRYLNNHRKKH